MTMECSENLPAGYVRVTAREFAVLFCSGEADLLVCLPVGQFFNAPAVAARVLGLWGDFPCCEPRQPRGPGRP